MFRGLVRARRSRGLERRAHRRIRPRRTADAPHRRPAGRTRLGQVLAGGGCRFRGARLLHGASHRGLHRQGLVPRLGVAPHRARHLGHLGRPRGAFGPDPTTSCRHGGRPTHGSLRRGFRPRRPLPHIRPPRGGRRRRTRVEGPCPIHRRRRGQVLGGIGRGRPDLRRSVAFGARRGPSSPKRLSRRETSPIWAATNPTTSRRSRPGPQRTPSG